VREHSGPAKRSVAATQAGWCFIGLILATGAVAFTTGNNLLYLVLGSMIGFLILSGLLSEATLRGLEVERALPDELYARAPARVTLRLTQRQTRIPAFALTLRDEIATARGLRPDPAGHARVVRLRSGESVARTYTFAPTRRGELIFQQVQVSTSFPFGLFVKRFSFERHQRAVVFPEVHPIDRVDGRVASASAQDVKGPGFVRADVVEGLRNFQQGDPLRRVHWKHSLRSGQLFVADRDRANAIEVEVVLEIPARAAGSLVEEHVTRAASKVHAYHQYGWNVSFRAEGISLPPASGRRHRNEILSFLAFYEGATAMAPASRPPEGHPQVPASR
jgi:uncharacterized protein (DUF58 family)